MGPRSEDHEGRRPSARLRDIAQLYALAPRRRRRIMLDRAFEPAVEPPGRHAVRPDFALLERGAHQRIDALARRARNGEHGHALGLAEPAADRVANAVDWRGRIPGDIPFVQRAEPGPALPVGMTWCRERVGQWGERSGR